MENASKIEKNGETNNKQRNGQDKYIKTDFVEDIIKLNVNLFTHDINNTIPVTYNKLIEYLNKYENHLLIYLSNYKCKLINGKFNKVILSVYNEIISCSNMLFSKNKFVSEISDINCVFETIDDNKFIINNDLALINPQLSENNIIEYVAVDSFKDLFLTIYFKLLNEFILMLYIYYINKDIICKSYNLKYKKLFTYMQSHPSDLCNTDIIKNIPLFGNHKSKQKKDRRNQSKKSDKNKLENIDDDQNINIDLGVLDLDNDSDNIEVDYKNFNQKDNNDPCHSGNIKKEDNKNSQNYVNIKKHNQKYVRKPKENKIINYNDSD